MAYNRYQVNRYLIVISFIIVGIAFFLRSHYREPISDDLLYSFILDEHPLGENQYVDKIETIDDAIQSQKLQYFHSNGRTLIHIIVQMFAGPWGKLAFDIFNTSIFLITILLFGKLTLSRSENRSALIWIGIVATFLYLYQDNSTLFYSIAGSLNYLLPMLIVIGFILLFNWAISKSRINAWIIPSLLIIGLLTGWSQECFSLPLSGAIFLYILLNYRQIPAHAIAMSISLFVGTAILIFAPGNFIRAASRPSLTLTLINAANLFFVTKLFWLAIITIVMLRLKSIRVFRNFCLDNKLYLSCWIIACLFGCVANTLPQSFSGIAFFSAILIFRAIRHLWTGDFIRYNSLLSATLILLLIVLHQSIIVNEAKKMQIFNHEFAQRLISTPPNEPIEDREISVSWSARPYIYKWTDSHVIKWMIFTLRAFYLKNLTFAESNKIPLLLLKPKDYSAYIADSAFFSANNKIPGNNPIYIGEKYIWVRDSSLTKDMKYEAQLHPISPKDTENPLLKIKFLLFKNSYPDKQTFIMFDSSSITNSNGVLGIPQPFGLRKVKQVSAVSE